MVLQAIQAVLSIFIMLGVGMLLTHIGWLKDEHTTLISRLVVRVALPGMIISNLFTWYTRESLLQSLTGILGPLASILLALGIGYLMAMLGRVAKEKRGVFVCMCAFSNAVFIGVPVCVALFGESALPYVLLYYIANTVIFWTLGNWFLRKDNQHGGAGEPKQNLSPASWKDRLARVFPLPLIVFFACAALVLVGFKPHQVILSAAQYIGGMVTPLSLFFTSMVIVRMLKEKKIRWQRGYAWMLAGRFVLAPALMYVCVIWITPQASSLMRNVLIIQAAMPVMSQTPIVAGELGSDEEYAAGGMALSTLLSLVFIPLYMAIL